MDDHTLDGCGWMIGFGIVLIAGFAILVEHGAIYLARHFRLAWN